MKILAFTVSILVTFLFSVNSYSDTRAALAFQGLSFISSDFDNPDKSNFAFLGATLRSYSKKPELFMVDLDGYYALGNSNLSYLNIKEIYFTIEPENYAHFYIGRKVKTWSALDTDWNLGFYQPEFRGNPLTPENQGLTGLFWDHDADYWGASVFASPFFLPDQGPSYEIKEGRFETTNPWFHPPAQNIKFQGQILPIDYNIRKPETSDVVLQSIYALQLRYGEQSGFFSSLAAAYKPAQQLALGYTGILVTNRVKIDITPVVYYENLYSAEVGFRGSWGLAQFSLLQTRPIQPYFPSTVSNTPVIEDSLSWGPKFAYNWNHFQFEVSYLKTDGGRVTEVGPDASANRPSLTQRFLFREAAQLQVSYSEVFLKKFKWDSQFQYRQSQTDQFRQIRLKNKLNLKGPWAFWTDLVLIDTADDSNLNMNTYRNLDQLWIGASYDI